jgi:hypothetical protein
MTDVTVGILKVLIVVVVVAIGLIAMACAILFIVCIHTPIMILSTPPIITSLLLEGDHIHPKNSQFKWVKVWVVPYVWADDILKAMTGLPNEED